MLPKVILVTAVIVQLTSCRTTRELSSETTISGKISRGSIKYGDTIARSGRDYSEELPRKLKDRPGRPDDDDDEDLDETISEVEKYLTSHPELPKLTREEIIHYIHNISDSATDDTDNPVTEALWDSTKTTDRGVVVVLPEKTEGSREILTNDPSERYEDEYMKDHYASEESFEDEALDAPREDGNPSDGKIFVYPVYKPATEEYATTTTTTTTDATDRSYTNYNDAEMVTKRYNFENGKRDEGNGQPSNHRLEEESRTGWELQRLNGTIVVLPVKHHNYENPTENSQNAEVTTSPTTTTTGKTSKPPYLKRRVKTTTAKPFADSLEDFGMDESEKKTTKKPFNEGKIRKGSQKRTSTTEGPPKPEDVTKVMEILPPEMNDLLRDLGLNNQIIADEQPIREKNLPHPSIDPLSFSAFKPLPTTAYGKDEKGKFVDDGMKEFLATFGLLPDDRAKPPRKEKSLKVAPETKFIHDVPSVSMEIIPEDFKQVFRDLGLDRESAGKQSGGHIFNPSIHSVSSSQEQADKLKALLANIKKAVSGNDTESVGDGLRGEIIQQIKDLDNLTETYTTNKQQSQIDKEIKEIITTNKDKFGFLPADNITEGDSFGERFDEGPNPLLLIDDEQLKNEVKRQVTVSVSSGSSSGNSSNASAEDGDSKTTTTTTTEEPPNIEGLKESFGGGETAPDDADIDSALPPKKPNGLYLLLDWNSFLEVGTEDDRRRVNIRFQPKVGDGRHFIPVTVP